MKRCSKCGKPKPLSEFHRHRHSRDGHMNQCKACNNERVRAWYAANRERKAETDRAWYEANRERKAETDRAWKEANRERYAELLRAANARMRVKYPERISARRAVNNAIRAGKLAPASDFACSVCGVPAQQYHHHLGYAPEHWLDVVAVCIPCHVELDKEAN